MHSGGLHHIDNIVHHDVHSAKLRPHLNRDRENDPAQHARLRQGFEGRVAGFSLKRHGFFNFSILCENFGMIDVAIAMQIC